MPVPSATACNESGDLDVMVVMLFCLPKKKIVIFNEIYLYISMFCGKHLN
jgi:hypothetical protein